MIFSSMGTVVSLSGSATDISPVFAAFDGRFSLHNPQSELARVNSGAVALPDASSELREAYARALEWRSLTAGAFSPHRPDGAIDLNGIVKALAMDASSAVLVGDWVLTAGGDVLVNGDATVGIVDPFARERLLTSIRVGPSRTAVATSGIAERGEHIWGRSPDFAQVTVVTDDIVTADVLATAIMSGGWDALNASTSRWPIHVLAVDRSGNIAVTPGMRHAVAAAADSVAA
jgi:thiamine biosynthesis lipoprotein